LSWQSFVQVNSHICVSFVCFHAHVRGFDITPSEREPSLTAIPPFSIAGKRQAD
jgi:hypothetical protein